MKEIGCEADISTGQPEAVAQAWFPQADVDPRRTPRAESAPREGPQASVRLSPSGRALAGGPTGRKRWRSLRTKREFQCVYQKGVKRIGRLFVLFIYRGDDLARAVVASRKVGGAVARNRAKRLLREAIRGVIEVPEATAAEAIRLRLWPDTEPGDGLWIVATARAAIVTASCAAVTEELERLLDCSRRGDERGEGSETDAWNG